MERGKCKWCGRTRLLCRSHIVPNFWSKEARRAGVQIRAIRKGRFMPAMQQGERDTLLCSECEQKFGVTERRVHQNWKEMLARRQEVLVGREGKERWKPLTRRVEISEQKRRRRGQRTRAVRWMGVDSEAWRKLTAITAWRAAASDVCGERMTWMQEGLRTLVETGLWRGRQPEVLFNWVCVGRSFGPGRKENMVYEHTPVVGRSGNVRIGQGGHEVTLMLGKTMPGAERLVEIFDIQDDGTWVAQEKDFLEEPHKAWFTKSFRSYLDWEDRRRR